MNDFTKDGKIEQTAKRTNQIGIVKLDFSVKKSDRLEGVPKRRIGVELKSGNVDNEKK